VDGADGWIGFELPDLIEPQEDLAATGDTCGEGTLISESGDIGVVETRSTRPGGCPIGPVGSKLVCTWV
jgi:hypothetical protein